MNITRKSLFSGKENTLDLDITNEQYVRWYEGESLNLIVPDMSPDHREFIISGTYPGEWELMFPEEEEFSDHRDDG